MDISAHEVDYLAQSYWHGFRYRIGEMIGVDRDRRQVQVAPYFDAEGREVTPKRTFDYDILVVAVGSQNNDFGTPGVVEHAIKLESQSDARRFHERMVNACIRAHAQSSPLGAHQLKVAIIGLARPASNLRPNSTERRVRWWRMAWIRSILRRTSNYADRSCRTGAPALPERVSKETEKLLARLGVNVPVGAKVSRSVPTV
jgi:NADH dehydrogenase